MFTGINELNRSWNYTYYISVSLLIYVLLSYLLSRQFHGRFVIYSVKIRESILMCYSTRHMQRLVKFWQRRKKWEVDSASKLQQQSGLTVSWKYCSNLCSLRRLNGAGCEEVYTNLFETSSVGQVFQVGVSTVL